MTAYKALIKVFSVSFLLAGLVTACGYDDGARTNVNYNAETDGYMNRYYTDNTGQYYNIPGRQDDAPDLDEINDAPTRKAEELRTLNGR